MKATAAEILDAAQGFPVLMDYLFKTGQVMRGLEVAEFMRTLRPITDGYQLDHGALLNAYGDFDRDARERVPKSDGKDYEAYKEGRSVLLAKEHKVGHIFILHEDLTNMALMGIDPNLILFFLPLVSVQERKEQENASDD